MAHQTELRIIEYKIIPEETGESSFLPHENILMIKDTPRHLQLAMDMMSLNLTPEQAEYLTTNGEKGVDYIPTFTWPGLTSIYCSQEFWDSLPKETEALHDEDTDSIQDTCGLVWGGITKGDSVYYTDEDFQELRELLIQSTKGSSDYDKLQVTIAHEFQHVYDFAMWGSAGMLIADILTNATKITGEQTQPPINNEIALQLYNQLLVIMEARAIRRELLKVAESDDAELTPSPLYWRLSNIAGLMYKFDTDDDELDNEEDEQATVLETVIEEILSGNYKGDSHSEHILGLLVMIYGYEIIELDADGYFIIDLQKIAADDNTLANDEDDHLAAKISGKIMSQISEIALNTPYSEFLDNLRSQELEQALDYAFAASLHKVLLLPISWSEDDAEDIAKSKRIQSSLELIENDYPSLKTA